MKKPTAEGAKTRSDRAKKRLRKTAPLPHLQNAPCAVAPKARSKRRTAAFAACNVLPRRRAKTPAFARQGFFRKRCPILAQSKKTAAVLKDFAGRTFAPRGKANADKNALSERRRQTVRRTSAYNTLKKTPPQKRGRCKGFLLSRLAAILPEKGVDAERRNEKLFVTSGDG